MTNNDMPRCPKCGLVPYRWYDAFEPEDGDGATAEVVCLSCKTRYWMIQHVEKTYSVRFAHGPGYEKKKP